MSTEGHNASLTDLLPDTIIELYEVELSSVDGIKRFHAGKIVDKNIIFDGNVYHSLPIEADGFESRGDGTLPRPKLLVGNPDGLISDIIKRRDDMVGRSFKRIRVFLKYIDEANFPDSVNPFANSNPDSRFDDDYYVFNRKVSENKYFIEFELVSPLELESQTLPGRIMVSNYCPWRYRGIGCKYGSRPNCVGPTVAFNKPDGVTPVNNKNFFKYIGEDGKLAGEQTIPLGIPVADANDRRFDSLNNGYNLNRLVWAFDYSDKFTSFTVQANASDGATSLSVSSITDYIPPSRTLTLSSGGNIVGVFVVDTEVNGQISGVTSLSGKLTMSTRGATLGSGATGIAGYKKGDVVRIKASKTSIIGKEKQVLTQGSESFEPDAFFVCIQDHTSEEDPRYSKEYWIEDQCGKTLDSCKMRYAEYQNGLPFGGFPSIEAYRYTN